MLKQALGSEKRPILNGKINFPLTLAPMVGLSHVAMRRLLRDYLPEGAVTLWPTEMLNSRKIPREKLGETPESLRLAEEEALVPQILGNEEKYIFESVIKLQDWGASAIDINMGCPVQKALKHNYGVALMGDPDYAAQVVRMTKRSSSLPVSVKIRAGENGDLNFLKNFAQGLENAGADWLTLHPRAASQKRRGRADWSQIRFLKDNVGIPVIGNGDIQTADDVLNMLQETNCDMVMAGRALTARPWLLWQVGEKLGFPNPRGRSGRAPQGRVEEGQEYGRALLRLLDYMEEYFSENLAIRKFRFFVKTGSVWLDFGADLHARTTQHDSIAEICMSLLDFFSYPQEMSDKTQLRE